jgi:hypothetical protein
MSSNLNTLRAGFMRRASAPDISATALKLAYLIAYKYMNNDTGTARPSQDTLARDLAVSVRTVQRLLDILQPLGLVIIPGHGPNRASTYSIKPDKATPTSPVNTTPMSPIGGRKGDIQRQRTRHPAPEKATPVSPQLKKKNQEEEPRGAGAITPAPRERERGSLALTVSPGALAPVGGALEEVGVDRCAEILAIWQRPWGEDDDAARRAFATACREADPDDIIASARSWIAAADDPRFLKPLAMWLGKGLWKKQPPARRQRNGGKHALAERMLRRGQQP